MKQEILEALIQYTTKGLHCFPLQPGDKHPFSGSHGHLDASADIAEVLRQFQRHADANIGIATEPSGLTIVDVDPRNGGTEEQARALVPEIEGAPWVSTPQGGAHFYLSGIVRSGDAAPGIDIKSRGGYVVAPPSVTSKGAYAWQKVGTPPPLSREVVRAARPVPEREIQDRLFLHGERNRKMFESLSRKRRKEGAPLEALVEAGFAFRDTQCDLTVPFTDEDVKRVAEHAYKYADQVPVYPEARSLVQVYGAPLKPPLMLVNELVAGRQINMICGPPMSGKSLLALEIGISLAGGMPVLGHEEFSVPRPLKVAYVYGEQGEFMWENRGAAIATLRGLPEEARGNFYFVKGYGLELSSSLNYDTLVDLLKGLGVEVCILDPLAALSGVEDENDAVSVVRAVRAPLQRMADEHQITPLVVHHSTKAAAKGEPRSAKELVRGSGDLLAMLSTVVGICTVGSRVKCMIEGRTGGSSNHEFRLSSDTIDGNLAPPETLEEMIGKSTEFAPLEYVGAWKAGTKKGGKKVAESEV